MRILSFPQGLVNVAKQNSETYSYIWKCCPTSIAIESILNDNFARPRGIIDGSAHQYYGIDSITDSIELN